MLSCFLKSILLWNPSFLISPTSSSILFQRSIIPLMNNKKALERSGDQLSPKTSQMPTLTTTLSKFQLSAANT